MKEESQTEKQKNSNKVWIILFIVTLVALIALGIYGFISMRNLNKQINDQKNQITQLQNKNNDLQKELANKKAELEAVTKTQQNQTGYLKITQWVVEFKPSSDLTDLGYSLKNSNIAIFESSSLNQKLNKNAKPSEACGQGSLGLLSRGKAGEEFFGTTFEKTQGAIKVDEYYYVYQRPGSGCGGSGADVAALEKAWNEMAESVKTLKPIQ